MASPMAVNRPVFHNHMYPYYVQSFSTPKLSSMPQDNMAYDESPNHHQQMMLRSAAAAANTQDIPSGYILHSHIHSAPHSQHTSPLMHSPMAAAAAAGSLSQHDSPLLHTQPHLPQHSYVDADTTAYSVLSASTQDLTNNPPQASSLDDNSDYMHALENDPYFIPVQGVLPPSKNVDGRYECQLCDRSYTHAKHLKRHMMRHTGQKPYGCSWCAARFTRPDIRKRHVSKCKVRRKMEGVESIKIEEENPAKMISLKNKKMRENKQRKAAAAAAAAAAAVSKREQDKSDSELSSNADASSDEGNASPTACKASTSPTVPSPVAAPTSAPQPAATSSSTFTTPVQESLALPPTTITPPPANSEFDPSIVKKDYHAHAHAQEPFYQTPVLSSHDLSMPVPVQQQQQQQQHTPNMPNHQTVYFRAMPTPSMHSVPPPPSQQAPPVAATQQQQGYMAVNSSPAGYYMAIPPRPGSSAQYSHLQPPPQHQAPDMVPAAAGGGYGMGIYYPQPQPQPQAQPQQQMHMLTPQHYGLGLAAQQRMASSSVSSSSSCMYGESSPLETFVPPVYQEQ